MYALFSSPHESLDSRIVSVILIGETHERMIEIVILFAFLFMFLTCVIFSRSVPRTQFRGGTGEMKIV